MRNTYNILFYFYLIFSVILVASCLNGYLSFGNGLGDLYYLIFNTVVLLIAVIIYFLKNPVSGKTNYYKTFGTFLIVFTILILILKLTVLRGPEGQSAGL